MLKSDLKRCTQCGEVFEATAKDDQDIDDLDCPYLDCDGEGTIEVAAWSDRFDKWRADRMKTYIYYRGKVKVRVKNLYYIPLRKYNAVKREVKALFESDGLDLDDLDEDELERLQARIDEGVPDKQIVVGNDEETEFVDVDDREDEQQWERCPNCHNQDPDEVAKSEGEYRCERCIMGGFN